MPYFMGNVVSDQYLQDMLRSYRQGYSDANGPNFEDSDAPLLSKFEQRGITTNAGAYSLGQEDARADIGAGQQAHPEEAWSPGIPIPSQQPPAPPPPLPNFTPERQDAEIYATYQRSGGAMPSNATSGPPGPAGYASFPQLSGYTQPLGKSSISLPFIGDVDMMTLFVIAGMGVAVYLLMRKQK